MAHLLYLMKKKFSSGHLAGTEHTWIEEINIVFKKHGEETSEVLLQMEKSVSAIGAQESRSGVTFKAQLEKLSILKLTTLLLPFPWLFLFCWG